jgi:hypothetical protein
VFGGNGATGEQSPPGSGRVLVFSIFQLEQTGSTPGTSVSQPRRWFAQASSSDQGCRLAPISGPSVTSAKASVARHDAEAAKARPASRCRRCWDRPSSEERLKLLALVAQLIGRPVLGEPGFLLHRSRSLPAPRGQSQTRLTTRTRVCECRVFKRFAASKVEDQAHPLNVKIPAVGGSFVARSSQDSARWNETKIRRHPTRRVD